MTDNSYYKNIVRALKNGVVPQQGLKELLVGRKEEIQMFDQELDYVSQGGGSTKFLKGDYGSGKTFLSGIIREKAWNKNFIVSWVELGREIRFNKFENVYSKIVAGMRTKNYRDTPAFEYILQEWLNQLEEKIRYKEDLNPLDPEDREKLNRLINQEIEETLQNVSAFSSSFVNAIRGYYYASKNRENKVKNAAIGWLKGEENIPAKIKKKFNVKGKINKENALNYLKAIVKLIVELDYSGLVVIIDEAEMIYNIARKDFRNEAYENLRKIVDSTMNQELSNVFFLFTATEFFFTDEERGMASYQALSQRLDSIDRRDYKDLRKPIISLDGLDKIQLIKMAYIIRDIHSRVFNWNAVDRLKDKQIKIMVDQMVNRFGQEIKTLPREFLKVFIDELDLLQQNYDYHLDQESLNKAVDKIEDLSQEDQGESHVI